MDTNTKDILTLIVSGGVLIIQEILIHQRIRVNAHKIKQNTDITISNRNESREESVVIHKCLDETKALVLETREMLSNLLKKQDKSN